MKYIIFILLFQVLNGSKAIAKDTACLETNKIVGSTQISISYNQQNNKCWLSIHNMDAYKDLIYRDYLFSNQGLFLVFNSFGDGPPSQKTGAREFYTFPRKGVPEFTIDQDHLIITITLATGEQLTIDGNTSRILAMSQSQFFEDPQVIPENQGGVEIQYHSHILLDCGFKMGDSPSSNAKTRCTFSDVHGNHCKLRARDIFNYDIDGDSTFKFQDDGELAALLNLRCSNIDTSSLTQN